eukprot:PhM_4_TR14676/c0_g1_i2/m.87719
MSFEFLTTSKKRCHILTVNHQTTGNVFLLRRGGGAFRRRRGIVLAVSAPTPPSDTTSALSSLAQRWLLLGGGSRRLRSMFVGVSARTRMSSSSSSSSSDVVVAAARARLSFENSLARASAPHLGIAIFGGEYMERSVIRGGSNGGNVVAASPPFIARFSLSGMSASCTPSGAASVRFRSPATLCPFTDSYSKTARSKSERAANRLPVMKMSMMPYLDAAPSMLSVACADRISAHAAAWSTPVTAKKMFSQWALYGSRQITKTLPLRNTATIAAWRHMHARSVVGSTASITPSDIAVPTSTMRNQRYCGRKASKSCP